MAVEAPPGCVLKCGAQPPSAVLVEERPFMAAKRIAFLLRFSAGAILFFKIYVTAARRAEPVSKCQPEPNR
jgi:hypothetical protein